MYPNPAVDYIQIRGDFAEDSKLLIYDLIGWIVKQQDTPQGSTLIPVLDLSRGNYFVKVVQRNGVVRTAKLVKK
ncbi:MAG TPA: T9SS type A sorting domain-containing protein [Fibrobacteraceae bacterium]|nr:T9SS type A sorting domain-containing protein [Fibrobacteraceae bacterium]